MLSVIKSGAVVNFITVIIGTCLGLVFKKGIPERLRDILFSAMGLVVFYIAVTGLFGEDINPLVIVLSMAVGAVIGELFDIDKGLNKMAKAIEDKLNSGGGKTKIAEGFISATLIFCIGAMLIVGSIDAGIRGDNTTLYSKSLIDGVTSVVLASTMGVGVMLSAIPVLVLEGGITLLATVIAPYLNTRMISHIGVVGSLLILVISFNMLKLTKIKVANLLPAILLPLVFCLFM